MIYWVYLIFAGIFEVGVTFCLGKIKVASGLEFFGWCATMLCGMTISILLVNKSMGGIPLGIAYPVWTGIGAAGAVIVGCLFFGESVTFWRIFFITLLIIAIIGLEKS